MIISLRQVHIITFLGGHLGFLYAGALYDVTELFFLFFFKCQLHFLHIRACHKLYLGFFAAHPGYF